MSPTESQRDLSGKLLNALLADDMREVVEGNFAGVDAGWWWERRLDGGVVVCQELDPEEMVREVGTALGRGIEESRRIAVARLGLEDLDSVVLTYEIPGDVAVEEAARRLGERSVTPAGLAEKIYRQLADALAE